MNFYRSAKSKLYRYVMLVQFETHNSKLIASAQPTLNKALSRFKVLWAKEALCLAVTKMRKTNNGQLGHVVREPEKYIPGSGFSVLTGISVPQSPPYMRKIQTGMKQSARNEFPRLSMWIMKELYKD